MEGKDNRKQQETASNAAEKGREETHRFLQMYDHKKLSKGEINIVDRKILRKKLLEFKERENAGTPSKASMLARSEPEQDSKWRKEKPPAVTWRSSWDSQIDEHLSGIAAKQRKLDEAKMQAEMEERTRKEQEERTRKEQEERVRKEQEERVRKEQEERVRKEQEELARKDQEEWARKEQEEREREALRLKNLEDEKVQEPEPQPEPQEVKELAKVTEIEEKRLKKQLKRVNRERKRQVKAENARIKSGLIHKKPSVKKATKSYKGDGVYIRSRNAQNPDDIYGYLSTKHSTKDHIFERQSRLTFKSATEAKNEETGDERDMTWLLQLSSREEDHDKSLQNSNMKTTGSSLENSSWLFWLFLLIGGRQPFDFVLTRKNDEITCRMKKNRCNYIAFVITSLFLIILTLVSCFNLSAIIMTNEAKGDPHTQIEKLLFGKNKVSALLFITSLILASVSSINILIDGDSIAEYMTLWTNNLHRFNFDAKSGILAVTILYIIWSISLFLMQVIAFCLTVSHPQPTPFIEETHLLIAIVLRSFVPNILLSELEHPHVLWKYGAFIICIKAYGLYCSANFIIMVTLYAIGIRNLAYEWNFRLRIILRQINVKKNEIFLQSVQHSLSYQNMFDWHRKIVHLVERNSTVFCTILFAFYLSVAFTLAGELLDVAISTVGQEKLSFNLSESSRIYDLEKSNEHFMLLCFHLSQTLGIFLFVSFFLAETGIVVMSASNDTTRHNYSIGSTHRRRFVMSLTMSFGARKPHLLGAGGIFSIDRAFILGFLGFMLYFFSVMIQTLHPKLLNFPILIQFPVGIGKFTVVVKHSDKIEGLDLYDKNADKALDYEIHKILNPPTPSPSSPANIREISFNCDCSGAPKNQEIKCPGVELYRYCVYDANGTAIKSFSNTLECIYNPYPKSKGPYYDCFKNLLERKDNCGNLNHVSPSFGLGTKAEEPIVAKTVGPNTTNSIFSVECFNKDEYLPQSFVKSTDWFPCNMPKWFPEIVCVHNTKTADDPPDLKLEDFQQRVVEKLQSTLNLNVKCIVQMGPHKTPLVKEHVIGTSDSILEFPKNTDPVRQYFPFFHPKLLGKYLNKPTLQFCNEARDFKDVNLLHDDCGFLDFEGSGTPKYKVDQFNCYNKGVCTSEICKKWRIWYSDPKNQPIFA